MINHNRILFKQNTANIIQNSYRKHAPHYISSTNTYNKRKDKLFQNISHHDSFLSQSTKLQ